MSDYDVDHPSPRRRPTMPKPTLVQTILRRPSQSYSFPVEKSAYYHSTKPELFRLYANQALVTAAGHSRSSSDAEVGRRVLPSQLPSPPIPPTSSTSKISCPSSSHHTNSGETVEINDESDSDSNDVFFTPNTSPRISFVAPDSFVHMPSSTLPGPSTSTSSLSSTIATSSESLFADSVFSSTSDSTRVTSPVVSDSGHNISTKRNAHRSHKPTSSSENNLNWSKEVRWLVSPPPSTTAFTTKPKHARSQPVPSKRLTNKIAQTTPSIMMNMAVLMEENENSTRDSTGSSRPHIHTPQSSVIIVDPHDLTAGSTVKQRTPISESRHRTRTVADVYRSRSSSSTTPRSRYGTSRENWPDTPAKHSRSRSTTNPSRTPSRRQSPSPSRTPSPSSTPRFSSYAPSLPSHGTPGYTSLVLPRAPPPPSLSLTPAARTGLDGRVDLTLGGVAQTTMATVEIVRGLGAASKKGLWSTFSRRRTIGSAPSPGTLSEFLSRRDVSLAFTGHRPPPSYVSSSSVLVQVWAVGVDGVDGVLVREKSGFSVGKSNGEADVGYVPGRSFVGRVLECGWEVRGEDVRKGEWVVGLLDVRKCGALAEFIVVDRHRILRIPYPHMQSVNGQTSRSSSPSTPTTANVSLTLHEYALLPLCGIPAHRAVRTCLSALPGKVKRRRALVLRGHDGAGAFATQIFIRRGWHVCVHAPFADRDRGQDTADSDFGYKTSVEARVKAWGADGIVFDDGQPGAAVRVLEMLTEEGDVFDAVLDTVGGQDVWEAGSRLLRVGGRGGVFTTLVGHVVGRAVPSAGDHFRAGIRSLRRNGGGSSRRPGDEHAGGTAKDRGNVGYAWVSITQEVDWDGEDVRESLRGVLAMALEGGTRPWTGMVVPFERSPDVFVEGPTMDDSISPLGGGRTVVVKVVG